MQNTTVTLRTIINDEVCVSTNEERVSGMNLSERWLFDFRRIIMRSDIIEMLAEEFIRTYDTSRPFQLCGLEIAGVPMISSFSYVLEKKLKRPVNAFFIRKSGSLSPHEVIEGVIID